MTEQVRFHDLMPGARFRFSRRLEVDPLARDRTADTAGFNVWEKVDRTGYRLVQWDDRVWTVLDDPAVELGYGVLRLFDPSLRVWLA